MNNVIDIYNPATYPKNFEEILNNYTNKKVDEIFNNYFFKCAHVTCTCDINNYYKYGIIRPSKVVDGNLIINYLLKELILEPLVDNSNYEDYSKKYDKALMEEYNREKDKVVDWYGKYSSVYFSMDIISEIKVDNSKYTSLIENFGGELCGAVVLSEEKVKEIGDRYNSYAIFFKLSYEEIKKAGQVKKVINIMEKMCTKGITSDRVESCINKDISPSDFIEIIKIEK